MPRRGKKICLTGGPGAGKTAATEVMLRHFKERIRIVPEAASILYNGGFPRAGSGDEMKCVQRAIYRVQCESERIAELKAPDTQLFICDRGTLDGLAYWPDHEDFFKSVGSSLEKEFSRYDLVIHMQSPPQNEGYDLSNPARVETAAEASRLDEKLLTVWNQHPKHFVIKAKTSFLEKVEEVVALVEKELKA